MESGTAAGGTAARDLKENHDHRIHISRTGGKPIQPLREDASLSQCRCRTSFVYVVIRCTPGKVGQKNEWAYVPVELHPCFLTFVHEKRVYSKPCWVVNRAMGASWV